MPIRCAFSVKWNTAFTTVMIAEEASRPPRVSISNERSSLSVSHSSTVLTMNGMNRNSTPSVRMAGMKSATRISHPTKKFRTLNTIATTIAEPTLRIFTDGKIRARARTVTVSAARCRRMYMKRKPSS